VLPNPDPKLGELLICFSFSLVLYFSHFPIPVYFSASSARAEKAECRKETGAEIGTLEQTNDKATQPASIGK